MINEDPTTLIDVVATTRVIDSYDPSNTLAVRSPWRVPIYRQLQLCL